MAKKKPEDGERFEVLVSQVEAALADLEGGTLPLEDALKRYEEGVAALRRCMAILKQAEARVQVLSEQGGELVEKPFEEPRSEEGDKGKLF
ncbi:MAG: Exodeoxyribonuclease 7 small subunit [Planctomycetes bacterium]|nr:Exodeoxyribonuclease 7 small subunit [Planctomycetota bacterium]MCQ3949029.1 exodeoxyribonuclease VII small subunit [Planctomycetota bacterium]GIK54277.1 MAG: exodeoxyribonuclease 7 small subunit [Planctomycetota bacterium]HRJ77985.1 exodeoxyribonuclease VII small subunit [Planctomycetota bacterium]